ncbi:Uncharacterized protein dnl_31410 [Desulfonema limicola]|uniref:Uncharacterized protein n=1 Tax=Desulfonema limicola TaxID=45656 RepID=A0A975B8Q8_9BACT|nr:hypothetical protein [Desulfonema limicola]QTA80828.1 Uncharacterized protein dnl_31410 [Desulfonema limicola]
MTVSQLNSYNYYQNYEEFQEQSPLLAKTQSLLEQYKKKMPDEIIRSYLDEDTEKQLSESDYSISDNSPLIEHKKAPVFFLESKPLGERAVSLQKWRGIVTDVCKEYFLAKLINLTDMGYDEQAEIFFSEITDEDIELIKPGAVFYWSIGYNHSSTGQRRKFSDIRFRRLPDWSSKEIELARIKAKAVKDYIGWK